MPQRTDSTLAWVLMGMLCAGAPLFGASPALRLSGEIQGKVVDANGLPQMGASVYLYGRADRLERKTLTDDKGAFVFASLLPDLYSVRVTLASFVPAVRGNILVQPGASSLLNVSLATLFSSIQLVAPDPGQRAIMTDEWKWVLRSGVLTRPVLRLLPGRGGPTIASSRRGPAFTETRGLLKLSAGDGGRNSGFGNEADLGTAFALATSLFGSNHVQVAGNVGYGTQTGVPTTAFRTSFRRDSGAGQGSPQVSLTMRQLFLPLRAGGAFASGPQADGTPALRTMSVSFDDSVDLGEGLRFQYGFSLDSVTFLDRLNYFSPYARLTQDLGDLGEVEVTYTSGNPRTDLGPASEPGPEASLQREVNALTVFPRVSLAAGRARVQRGENLEIGYSRKEGSRTWRLGVYRERVSNAALNMVSPDGVFTATGDALPDLFSRNTIFNAGHYSTDGATASVTQNFGETFSATLVYGLVGALATDREALVTESPDALRSMIRAGRRHAATARLAGVAPRAGTQWSASYQWTDHRVATRAHMYSTQANRATPGFNAYIRQPIPTFNILPWRLEATADLRNLLAQGYLPIQLADGRRLLLVHTPRSFRGGLSFIF